MASRINISAVLLTIILISKHQMSPGARHFFARGSPEREKRGRIGQAMEVRGKTAQTRKKPKRRPKQSKPMQDEKNFKELSDAIMRDMNACNASNPQATFLQIEMKARELVSQLEAHLIEESAGKREKENWSSQQESRRPTCPICHLPLLSRGKRVRHLQATAGRDIRLERTYGTCPKCGTGFFPPR